MLNITFCIIVYYENILKELYKKNIVDTAFTGVFDENIIETLELVSIVTNSIE